MRRALKDQSIDINFFLGTNEPRKKPKVLSMKSGDIIPEKKLKNVKSKLTAKKQAPTEEVRNNLNAAIKVSFQTIQSQLKKLADLPKTSENSSSSLQTKKIPLYDITEIDGVLNLTRIGDYNEHTYDSKNSTSPALTKRQLCHSDFILPLKRQTNFVVSECNKRLNN